MKFTLDYLPYLHKVREYEIKIIFAKCPKKIFKRCLELGAGDGFQSTILTKYGCSFLWIFRFSNINQNYGNRQNITKMRMFLRLFVIILIGSCTIVGLIHIIYKLVN